MADTMTEGACLDLDEIFGGPMVYIPDAGEPEDDGWMAMAGGAMRFQSASSSASQ